MADKPAEHYAVVTGASQGLGKSFALELARRGINTILIALPDENVEEVVDQCLQLGVKSVAHETDLLKKENILEMTAWVNKHYKVNILINNAGLGASHSFVDSDLNYIDALIQLNITTTSLITHQLLPNLMAHKNAYILNVSSMASFSPFGYKTVYSASKRYIQHFSKALQQELKNTGVSISVVHPGPMKTNVEVIERIKKHNFFGRFGLESPDHVAHSSIKRMLRKQNSILIGFANKVNRLLLTYVPARIRLPILAKAVKKELESKSKAKE